MQKQMLSLAGILVLLSTFSEPVQAFVYKFKDIDHINMGEALAPVAQDSFTYGEAGGDAGESLATAQVIGPVGADTSINAISGRIGSASATAAVDDADLYGIFLTSNTTFTATVTAPSPFSGGVFDTALSLFNSSGNGLIFNDDTSGTNTLSTISFTPTQDGVYYLGISNYSYFAKDAANKFIFPDTTAIPGPDPTGLYSSNSNAGPLASWGNGAIGFVGDLGTYTINLTGATAVPEPATGGIFLGFALLGIRTFRRSRKA